MPQCGAAPGRMKTARDPPRGARPAVEGLDWSNHWTIKVFHQVSSVGRLRRALNSANFIAPRVSLDVEVSDTVLRGHRIPCAKGISRQLSRRWVVR